MGRTSATLSQLRAVSRRYDRGQRFTGAARRRSTCSWPSPLILFFMETGCHSACPSCGGYHAFGMFLVTEADADAIRAIFNQEGELSAAIELRRRFPGITRQRQGADICSDDRRMETAAGSAVLGYPAAAPRRERVRSVRRPRSKPQRPSRPPLRIRV
jgi:hypothetical protein